MPVIKRHRALCGHLGWFATVPLAILAAFSAWLFFGTGQILLGLLALTIAAMLFVVETKTFWLDPENGPFQEAVFVTVLFGSLLIGFAAGALYYGKPLYAM